MHEAKKVQRQGVHTFPADVVMLLGTCCGSNDRTTVTAAGTPAYMAPELLQDCPFNKSVDVYAFGILLWEVNPVDQYVAEGWGGL